MICASCPDYKQDEICLYPTYTKPLTIINVNVLFCNCQYMALKNAGKHFSL